MIFAALLTLGIINANGQPRIISRNPNNNPVHLFNYLKPYAFSYYIDLGDNGAISSRRESSDDQGRVEGSYTIQNDEGYYRVVQYTADENGFRASIETNEPGTSNKSPADVTIHSERDTSQNMHIPEIYTAQNNDSLAFPVSVTRSGRPGTLLSKDTFRGTPV